VSPWTAVLFDLFDTLVVFDRSRLPEIHLNGRLLRSTAGQLHRAFESFVPGIDFADFAGALFWSWQEAERRRDATRREVTAPERFALMLERLGVTPTRLPAEAVPTLLATHQRELGRAVVFPAHHGPMLRRLRRRYRLAVVSNFDYAPTPRGILAREGIAGLFDAVLVSAEVGWRKPEAAIFHAALEQLGIGPDQALFVGDRLEIDVAGAQGVGMRAAWINRTGDERPAGAARPDFEIKDLTELEPILGIAPAGADV
jgi:FMN phosphatase YigB (HAD superfamily)